MNIKQWEMKIEPRIKLNYNIYIKDIRRNMASYFKNKIVKIVGILDKMFWVRKLKLKNSLLNYLISNFCF